MRVTTRGWVVIYCIAAVFLTALLVWADAYVLDLTPSQAEMESLR